MRDFDDMDELAKEAKRIIRRSIFVIIVLGLIALLIVICWK